MKKTNKNNKNLWKKIDRLVKIKLEYAIDEVRCSMSYSYNWRTDCPSYQYSHFTKSHWLLWHHAWLLSCKKQDSTLDGIEHPNWHQRRFSLNAKQQMLNGGRTEHQRDRKKRQSAPCAESEWDQRTLVVALYEWFRRTNIRRANEATNSYRNNDRSTNLITVVWWRGDGNENAGPRETAPIMGVVEASKAPMTYELRKRPSLGSPSHFVD